MRRIIAFLTALIMMLSMSNYCFADSIQSSENTLNTLSDESDYSVYSEKFADYPSAKAEIEAADFGADGKLLNDSERTVSFKVTVPENGWYQPEIEYLSANESTNNPQIDFLVDGAAPCPEMQGFELTRLWQDAADEITADKDGNQFSPEQTEVKNWQTTYIYDPNGFVSEPLRVALSAGEHTVTLTVQEESVYIRAVKFSVPEILKTYDELKAEYESKGYKKYAGEAITIEGEDAVYKNSPLIISLIDRSDPSVWPSDPYHDKINYIGGSNWKSPGDTIQWEVDVPESGLYNLYFHFKQTYLQESASYRTLYIDGKIPYSEAASLAFRYDSGWQYGSLSEDNYRSIYLSEGKHTISLKVTLGEMSSFANSLRGLVARIGDIYRQIVMITGESPDSARDYNLFYQLPDLEKELTDIRDQLDFLADESEKTVGSKGGTNATTLRRVITTIDQMLNVKYKAHTRVSSLYSNYSSLASWLYEMQDMALDIDAMFLTAPDTEYKRDTGLFDGISFTFKRLISSFMEDYSEQADSDNSITVWCNWGRDQISALDSLINSSFTPEYGTEVNIKITTASVIQANLSGRGPDLMLNQSRSAPVNYAMRNAVYDISKFSDYEEVIKRFSQTAMDPYKYKGGVYGIPETQSFYMMFVRTDIFEELGLAVPRTWDEFILASKVIFLNNMEVAIPYTQVTNDAVNAGAGALTLLPTIAQQKGVSLYNEEQNMTTFATAEMLDAATVWTDFYTKYKFPKTYNFFNRFRTGTIPLAIQDYTQYATISAAAPEISGRWTMVQIPGFLEEDGSINNTVSGSGNAAVILADSEKKELAWDFLKWYTSEDIQYRFSKNLESILGVSARRPTANIEAMKRLGWNRDMLSELIDQWNMVQELPEIPGSYYVIRSIDQIYWNVVDGGKDVQEMLKKWGAEADNEIKRKIEEYNLQ